jgi:hypothetical protein
MLAARITLAHFSVSSAMNLPKPVGDKANTVPPKSAIRAFSLWSARPRLISLLSLSITQAERNQQDGGPPADLGECRQQPDEKRGSAHHDDGHEEGVFASNQIAGF